MAAASIMRELLLFERLLIVNKIEVQLTEYFSGNLKAAPETLGDPQREAAEDIQERYERVIASSFSSLSALLVLYSKGNLLNCS